MFGSKIAEIILKIRHLRNVRTIVFNFVAAPVKLVQMSEHNSQRDMNHVNASIFASVDRSMATFKWTPLVAKHTNIHKYILTF